MQPQDGVTDALPIAQGVAGTATARPAARNPLPAAKPRRVCLGFPACLDTLLSLPLNSNVSNARRHAAPVTEIWIF